MLFLKFSLGSVCISLIILGISNLTNSVSDHSAEKREQGGQSQNWFELNICK